MLSDFLGEVPKEIFFGALGAVGFWPYDVFAVGMTEALISRERAAGEGRRERAAGRLILL